MVSSLIKDFIIISIISNNCNNLTEEIKTLHNKQKGSIIAALKLHSIRVDLSYTVFQSY